MNIRKSGEAYFHRLIKYGPETMWDKGITAVLSGLSRVYTKAMLKKMNTYLHRENGQTKLPVKVLSIGNITVGGTGKTPMACYIAEYLYQSGYKAVLLNRGYKAKKEGEAAVLSDGKHCLLSAAEGGDEPYLLAKKLPYIPVVIGRKRSLTGQLAVQTFQPDILIMDDGFQHWAVYRDLDIVLIDSTNPFGNKKVIPGGILREPIEHLNRADLVILTKTDQIQSTEDVCETIRCYNKNAPIVESIHKIKGLCTYQSWAAGEPSWHMPKEKRAIAFSAIGNPASFHHLIETMGIEVAETYCFEDHHQYTVKEIEKIVHRAKQAKMCIITTEKDAVKLSEIVKEELLYILTIEIEITKGKEILERRLRELMEG